MSTFVNIKHKLSITADDESKFAMATRKQLTQYKLYLNDTRDQSVSEMTDDQLEYEFAELKSDKLQTTIYNAVNVYIRRLEMLKEIIVCATEFVVLSERANVSDAIYNSGCRIMRQSSRQQDRLMPYKSQLAKMGINIKTAHKSIVGAVVALVNIRSRINMESKYSDDKLVRRSLRIAAASK